MEVIKAQTGVNAVQQFSALNSFKSNRVLKPTEDIQDKTETASGVKTTTTPSLLDRIDVNELRKYAETVGEYDISDDDIKYGLLYGRSVIAEWLC